MAKAPAAVDEVAGRINENVYAGGEPAERRTMAGKKTGPVKAPAKAEGKKAKKDTKLESEIEKIMVDGVKTVGGRAYKWVSPGNDGVPDRIVIIPNRAPIFVELKRAGEMPTSIQQAQINRLKELGQDVRIVKGEEGVRNFLLTLTSSGKVML